jgi:transcriptional regulator with XRE-family HTH domain
MKVGSIGEYIRQQREQAKISLRQLASAAGVSNPYLSQIERGLRRPSAEILQQIAKGLRISAEALYVQAGILEDRQSDSGVRAAVLADPGLSERQKQVLLEIYESFRKEMAAGAEDAGTGDDGPDGVALEGMIPDGMIPEDAVLQDTVLDGIEPDLDGIEPDEVPAGRAPRAGVWADVADQDLASQARASQAAAKPEAGPEVAEPDVAE